jgi:hypothetical protein
MSALPPEADMFSVEINVCFVPEADMNLASDDSSILIVAHTAK